MSATTTTKVKAFESIVRAKAAVTRIALLLQRHEQEHREEPDDWLLADIEDAQVHLEEAESLLGWLFDAQEGA
jgi:hypothetical protein